MDIIDYFKTHVGYAASWYSRAPGRVNLLGEHVDYNDGPVLPVAIDRAVHLAAAPRQDRNVRLYARDLDQSVSFSLDRLTGRNDIENRSLPGWARYPAGVAWALQEVGLEVRGFDGVYSSEIPIGAGLSSSAAVEVSFAALWQGLGGWDLVPLRLAQICQQAENVYVGVPCGLMDQFASACGVKGHALYFDTRSLDYQPAPFPEDCSIVIADSGGRRNLTSSAYNERRAACEQAVDILRLYLPKIHSLRDVTTTEFAAYAPYLPETVRKRAEHVVKEIARVNSAFTALLRGDEKVFGALMFAGHASLRDLYEVSTPELDTLVSLARELPGCLGARLTGAGFGGCTVNLVEMKYTDEFIKALIDGYESITGQQVQVFVCQASQGATVQSLSDEN